MLLTDLFHHRWTLPVAAECAALGGGARFVQLANRLGMSRESLKAALDHLVALGVLERNAGYGHPARPEYVLTPRGLLLSGPAAEFLEGVRSRHLGDLALRKYPMPVLLEIGDGAHRFGELRRALPGATPAALSDALRGLEGASLAARLVVPSYPPTPVYRLERAADALLPALAALRAA
ncbi:MAG: winged helix-turn-helix transcriptional regulator [Candidatus Sumerlaeia bacterium]|nr:winged helix-turn-helix transcriptional regulator [Candidatus Sumerlaeia bacterium]